MLLRSPSSRTAAAAIVLLVTLTLGGCGTKSAAKPQTDGAVTGSVATVNGDSISQKELDEELNRKYGQEVLENLVDDKLIEQAAKKENIKVADSDVKTRLDELKRSPQYQQLVKVKHMSDSDLEAYLRRLLLLQKLILLEIPEQDKLKVFDQYKEGLEQAHIYHILVEPTKKSDALKILDQIKHGKDFEAAARDNSKDPGTKDNGGDLGWVPRSAALDPAFMKVAFSLPINQVSQPVQSHLGWHLINVTARRKTYDDLKNDIEDRLVAAHQMEYLRRLRVKADIKTKYDQADGHRPADAKGPDTTADKKTTLK